MSDTTAGSLQEEVREYYRSKAAEAETSGACCSPDPRTFGPAAYDEIGPGTAPDAALLASLGCGNPSAVAELREGETVLDLGSGGGLDVILSARRVGPDGRVFGLDFLEEMLALAGRNVADAEIDNVVLLKGTIESIPLPADTIDVIISNCVINLSLNKPAVFAEMARVLAPGGRLGISDVVAEDRLSPAERAERGGHSQCIAGALSVAEYKELLDAVGLKDAEVVFTQEAADGLHAAIIRARKPVDSTVGAQECDPGGTCC
ncbi:methyltransferase domain-containing protein [Streptomyces sp. NBC_00525]|uniref:methyltransferase domain-containing protein n=1 Tax=Streptomyces sp. NBC_00525 TaxID=2903660 RepID=UPI002E823D67|nr:methyltransferase domain-containing protein [Streptomyces sp. NBC_00525]WUC97267.1 methyltransferase domain-containing protein [Streptomyces sp. NBC_00525]